MINVPPALTARVTALCAELDRRSPRAKQLERYYDGNHPLAQALARAAQGADGAYRFLTALAKENWGGTVVDAKNERIELQGARFGETGASKEAWQILQRNHWDAESKLLHQTALITGRAFAIAWDEDGDGLADITIEDPTTTVVEYVPGSRFNRVAALRRWQDGGIWYATLFLPDGLYKFVAQGSKPSDSPPTDWDALEVDREDWPIDNPIGRVPVVEFGINRRLRSGKYGTVKGEFEPHIAVIDRIHYTVLCGLAGLTWAGFQALALIGDPIKYATDPVTGENIVDDMGNLVSVAPFTYAPGKLIQVANPDAKLQQLSSDDVDSYLKHSGEYISRLAMLTETPIYKMGSAQLVNVGVEAMRVLDDGHLARIGSHEIDFGESHEELLRLCFLIEGDDAKGNFAAAEAIWKDPEMTTMAVKADAAVKLNGVLPWQVIASLVFHASPTQIDEWQALKDAEALTNLLTAPPQPPAPPFGAPPAPGAPATPPPHA